MFDFWDFHDFLFETGEFGLGFVLAHLGFRLFFVGRLVWVLGSVGVFDENYHYCFGKYIISMFFWEKVEVLENVRPEHLVLVPEGLVDYGVVLFSELLK